MHSDNTTIEKRVQYLVNVLFGGNQSKMAESIGCSRSAISLAVTGKRPLGRELLRRLAEHPKISPAWLLTGDGEPFVAEREPPTGTGLPLPLLDHPIPGPPASCPQVMTGETYPVPGDMASASRYWVRTKKGLPLAQVQSAKLRTGDLLLIESDVAPFQHDPPSLQGRLGAVRLPGRGAADARLVRFEKAGPSEQPPDASTAATGEVAIDIKRSRAVLHFGVRPQYSNFDLPLETSKDESEERALVGLDDVVGVVIVLVRTNP